MTTLTFIRRETATGRPCIAAFIGEWNVWNIPVEHWCDAVENAILHAYELGWRHCNTEHAEIQSHSFPMDARFKEEQ